MADIQNDAISRVLSVQATGCRHTAHEAGGSLHETLFALIPSRWRASLGAYVAPGDDQGKDTAGGQGSYHYPAAHAGCPACAGWIGRRVMFE